MTGVTIRKFRQLFGMTAFAISLLAMASGNLFAKDHLPSWNDGASKRAILEFVAAVSDKNGPDYVEPSARIATFDNDGTLWIEYPMYTQLVFAMDRVKELAPQHPEWKTTQPFQAVLEGDMKTLGASGMKGLMEIMMATHAGMTAEEFEDEAGQWLKTTKNEKFDRLYAELIYQPQLELMTYLRLNGFKTFIVSGGGIAFMRPITERAYGIPPEQVVGSSIAFGNSDSDMQMIEYTTTGEGRRLGLFVHHTDAEREYAYDRQSHVGTLDKALDRAGQEGWIIVSMKDDWNRVWPD